MILIFSFSARPAEVSSEDSRQAGLLIGEIFVPGFEDWTEEEQAAFAEKVDHPVRKTAHAAEYAVLGLLVAGAYIEGGKKGGKHVGEKRGRETVFCQVLFPEKSVGIPFFQQGIFPAFSGHYASLRMRACSIR